MNLEYCFKRKFMRDDKRRIRLLNWILLKNGGSLGDGKYFSEYFKHEMTTRGGFRLVYPCTNTGDKYTKFFDQVKMQAKPKLEATKRMTSNPKTRILRDSWLTLHKSHWVVEVKQAARLIQKISLSTKKKRDWKEKHRPRQRPQNGRKYAPLDKIRQANEMINNNLVPEKVSACDVKKDAEDLQKYKMEVYPWNKTKK